MSQTFLEALGRPLRILLRAIATDRRSNRSDESAIDTTDALRTDGGDDGEFDDEDADADHLRDVPDGAGCTEIWEHLSERQAANARCDD